MAVIRAILRLKWALLIGGFKGSLQSRVQIGVSVLLSFVMGGASLLVLAVVGQTTENAHDILVVLLVVSCGAIGIAAAVTGVEASLDPRQLAAEPLTDIELGVGMLASAVVGPPAILAAFSGVGVFLGWRSGVLTRDLVLVLVVVLWWATLLLVSRTIANVLGIWAAGRMRQLAQVGAALAGLSGWLIAQIVSRNADHWTAAALHKAARWLTYTPPGQLGTAVGAATSGRVVLAMVAGTAWLPLLLWISVRTTRSFTTMALAQSEGRSVRVGATGWATGFGLLRAGRVGAVASRSLRTKVRTPRQAVNTLTALVVGGGAFLLLPLLDSGVSDPRLVLTGGLLQFAVLFDANNAFGLDGPPLWSEISAGATGDSLVRSKVLTSVMTVGPFAVVLPFAIAAMTGGWVWLSSAIAISIGAIASAAGVAVLMASLAPVAVPISANPFATGDAGQGCIAGLMMALGVVALGIVTLPVMAGVYYASSRSWFLTFAMAMLAVLVGLGVMLICMRLASMRLVGFEADLIEKVTPKK